MECTSGTCIWVGTSEDAPCSGINRGTGYRAEAGGGANERLMRFSKIGARLILVGRLA